ncbi:MAG: DUF4105 domain-containing protein [Bdellovibrionota bacterium]
MKFYLFILLSLFVGASTLGSNALASPLDDANMKTLAHSKEWLRFLNYKKGLFGYKSEADGKNFFLSAKGKTNPKDELKALAFELMSRKAVTNDHARCRFPARSQFLSEKLGIPLAKEDVCTEYQKFKKSLDAESVSLVFSAYYINNPSSVFGHTFLRVNKHKEKNNFQNTELLDLGVNFAANPWTKNPIVYTFGGIVGMFPGIYSTMPYYYKVREYNDFESRDLWSYKLDFTNEEVERLVRHLWELGQTDYDYFFFTENCSYHIFTALEAAAPRFNLTDGLPYWVIPSDTVLITAKEKGLLKEVSFRPSIRNIFLTRYESLTKEERAEFLALSNSRSREVPKTFSEASRVKIIDTLIDWIEYKHSGKVNDEKTDEYQWKKDLLVKRVELPPQENEIKVTEPVSKPHDGHGSQRLGIEPGYSEMFESFQRYHVRFALHDLLDPDFGYPENAQIEFFNTIFQSSNDFKKWDLYQWTLVSVRSMAPFETFEKRPSWDMSFGVKSYQDDKCAFCQGGYFQSSWGLATNLSKFTLYAMGSLDLSYSQKFDDNNFRAQVGPKVGILFRPKIDFKVQLEGTWLWDPIEEYDSYQGELSLRKALSKEYAIGASGKIRNDITEGSVQFFYFH